MACFDVVSLKRGIYCGGLCVHCVDTGPPIRDPLSLAFGARDMRVVRGNGGDGALR